MEVKYLVIIFGVVSCFIHWGHAGNGDAKVKSGGKVVRKRTGGVEDPDCKMTLTDWIDLGYEGLKAYR